MTITELVGSWMTTTNKSFKRETCILVGMRDSMSLALKGCRESLRKKCPIKDFRCCGEMADATDLKSVSCNGSVGSSPTSTIIQYPYLSYKKDPTKNFDRAIVSK